MYLKDIAERTIQPAIGKKTLIAHRYITPNIINEILKVDKTAFRDVARFMNEIHYKGLEDLSRKLHAFVRANISYVEDPLGEQFIKTPAATWKDKFADCKGYSIFLGSCLKSIGIPYSYRFVSFKQVPRYTHVYVITHGLNGNYIIDCCLPEFNTEKPYTYKKDYKMEGLYRIE
ncbi:MAG: hypothetical protein WC389_13235, partial [Lutibacter sp.]